MFKEFGTYIVIGRQGRVGVEWRSDICLFMLRIEIDESEGEDDDIEIIEPHP